jgi:hypothetical protein
LQNTARKLRLEESQTHIFILLNSKINNTFRRSSNVCLIFATFPEENKNPGRVLSYNTNKVLSSFKTAQLKLLVRKSHFECVLKVFV